MYRTTQDEENNIPWVLIPPSQHRPRVVQFGFRYGRCDYDNKESKCNELSCDCEKEKAFLKERNFMFHWHWRLTARRYSF